jgi:hypothetical protein
LVRLAFLGFLPRVRIETPKGGRTIPALKISAVNIFKSITLINFELISVSALREDLKLLRRTRVIQIGMNNK